MEDEAFSIHQVVSQIYNHNKNWQKDLAAEIQSHFNNNSKAQSQIQVHWSPPNSKYFKLNFDGSNYDNGSTAIGFIIRNHFGTIINSGAMRIHNYYSILGPEALALREGVKNALALGIRNLQIEGDNLSVINAIREISQIPWEIHNLIHDTYLDLFKFSHYSINHIYREANCAADYLANKGHSHPIMTYWYDPCDHNLSQPVFLSLSK